MPAHINQSALHGCKAAMNHRAGRVKLDGQPVGIIEETDSGTRFTYGADWLARADAVPVSLTMPLRAVPYESKELHPFFENLLPAP